jgi:hypothetical protein
VDEAINPYKSPETEALKPLGSLSQAARGKEIKQAQIILMVIGLLTIAVNGFFLFSLPYEIKQAIQQNQIPPEQVEQVRQAMTISGYLIYGSPALLGIVFLVFGIIIKRFPVPITVTSLVLYLLATAAFALLDPMSLAQGFIMKIIIIFALFRAIKAARAFQAHSRKAEVVEGLLE